MKIKTLAVGPLQANCHIAWDPESRAAAIIDPGGDASSITGILEKDGLSPACLINTHAHPDHVSANAPLMRHYHIPLCIHRDDAAALAQSGLLGKLLGFIFEQSPPPDRLLAHGDIIEIGRNILRVLHTPGHTPGSICLLSESPGEDPLLFSGDTLFEGSVGRTDLPGGSYEMLIGSIRNILMPLPDKTVILPGHGPATTMGREKRHNPFLNGCQ